MNPAAYSDQLGGWVALPDYDAVLYIEWQFTSDRQSSSNASNEVAVTSVFYPERVTYVLTPPLDNRVHVTGDNKNHDWYTNGHNYIEPWKPGRIGLLHNAATGDCTLFLPSGTVKVFKKANTFRMRYFYNVCTYSKVRVFTQVDEQLYDPTPHM